MQCSWCYTLGRVEMNRATEGYTKYISRLSKKCVFISYKSEDLHIAKEVGAFLKNQLHVDVYLDTLDIELKEAVSKENDEKIVKSIKME